MDAMGKQKAAQQQDQANKQNAMMQLMLMDQHLKTQDRFRGQGEGAWSAALDDLSAISQIGRQSQEEARLAAYLNEDAGPVIGAPNAPSLGIDYWNEHPTNSDAGGIQQYSDKPATNTALVKPPSTEGGFKFDPKIAGSKQGGQVFQQDLARKLATAARGARGQINALARLSSYGGSYGGLGTDNPLILQNSSNAINLWNNFRRGDLRVYEAEKAIPASQYTYKQSPLASLGGLFGKGMGGLGEAAGSGGADMGGMFSGGGLF